MIYFDNASTNKVEEKVLEIYNKYTLQYYANPSSPHTYAKECERIYLLAKEQILKSLNLHDYDIVFTSGATEANNLALLGYARRNKANGNHIITTKIEHASILNTCEELEKEGFVITYLNVDKNGKVDLNELKESINDKTILVSIMSVNNEIGSTNDIKKIKNILKSYPKIVFHSDAAQSLGKINIDYNNIDMFTISAHKIGGLKSIGALVFKKNIKLLPVIFGGNQQEGLRSGTMDLSLAVSFAVAVKLAINDLNTHYKQVDKLNKMLRNYLNNHKDEYEINSPDDALAYILNFSLKNKKASVVVEALAREDIMVSSVSACSSKKEPFSYVIKALNKDDSLAKNTIRISFSYLNNEDEINEFINKLETIVGGVKG